MNSLLHTLSPTPSIKTNSSLIIISRLLDNQNKLKTTYPHNHLSSMITPHQPILSFFHIVSAEGFPLGASTNTTTAITSSSSHHSNNHNISNVSDTLNSMRILHNARTGTSYHII